MYSSSIDMWAPYLVRKNFFERFNFSERFNDERFNFFERFIKTLKRA